jgi:hypothetical protein
MICCYCNKREAVVDNVCSSHYCKEAHRYYARAYKYAHNAKARRNNIERASICVDIARSATYKEHE